MTPDSTTDADLYPAEAYPAEKISLGLSTVIAVAGLVGYTLVSYPVIEIPVTSLELLGGSVLAYGLGIGAFSILFNVFTSPDATRAQAQKVASVYVPVLILVAALVGAGAFDPRLAMTFLTLLAGTGIVYAIFRHKRMNGTASI